MTGPKQHGVGVVVVVVVVVQVEDVVEETDALLHVVVIFTACRQHTRLLSWHSTTRTPTSSPTSSRESSRECRRVVQLATGITSIARVGRVREEPREDVGVGVGVVECQL